MRMYPERIMTYAFLLSGLPVFGMNIVEPEERGNVPFRVHVFEDYETEIEKRWWLRGEPIEKRLPPSLSPSVPNKRAFRSTETKDFDRKMGDQTKTYRAVIFNPVTYSRRSIKWLPMSATARDSPDCEGSSLQL